MTHIPPELTHWFKQITSNSPFFFAILDQHYSYVLVNTRYAQLTNKSCKQLIGSNDQIEFGSEFYHQLLPHYQHAMSGEIIEQEMTLPLNKRQLTIHFTLFPLTMGNDQLFLLFQAADTSETKILTDSLHESNQQFNHLIKLLNEGVFIVESDHIISMNHAAMHLLGVKSNNELLGKSLSWLFINPHTKVTLSPSLTEALGQEPFHCLTNTEVCGSEKAVILRAQRTTLFGMNTLVVVMNEKKAASPFNPSQRNSHKDPLTGLYNRAGFTQGLRYYMNNKKPLLVMYIDIDNFKNINDSLGHHVGDNVIREIATRLKRLLPPHSLLGHLGADEFALAIPTFSSSAMADSLSERIIALINQPFDLNMYSKRLACSIGSASFPSDGNDAKTLLQHADTAMFEAKNQGRNRMIRFNEQMNQEARSRLWLEIELQKALQQNSLKVWYQPKVSACDYRINGAEALLRWKHPSEGYISPGAFIPVAEKSGLIDQIGRVVMREVFLTVKRWKQQGILPGSIAINLSPEQFCNPKLLDYMEKLLLSTQVEPSCITFELTESAVMNNNEHTLKMLTAIKKLGFALSIDDFGTGYSSLSYLARFPIDELKIDKTFINDINQYPKQMTVIENIINLGKSLDLSVVVEGVETQHQATLLSNLHCHSIQGFHFHRPQPKQDIERLFLQHSQKK